MGSRIQCFMIEPVDRQKLYLRRYSPDKSCSVRTGYHNARVFLCEAPAVMLPDGCLDSPSRSLRPSDDDPRWPRSCACGRAFDDGDVRQVFTELIYRRADIDDALTTLDEAPAGAMWDATWWPEKGPDGRALCVKLPPGRAWDHWLVDGPSKGGGRWTRTGDAPRITARPSILTPDYHGFLTDGVLEEC